MGDKLSDLAHAAAMACYRTKGETYQNIIARAIGQAVEAERRRCLQVVSQNRRHIERSAGAGTIRQEYSLATCDDIEQAIRSGAVSTPTARGGD